MGEPYVGFFKNKLSDNCNKYPQKIEDGKFWWRPGVYVKISNGSSRVENIISKINSSADT